MGRKPLDKPWLHSPTGYWCVTFDGKREYLDRDYQVARRKLKALKARRKRELAGGREWLDQPFSVLADDYMADVKARKRPATYRAVRYSLLRALKTLGSTMRVGEVRKLHLAKIEQALAPDEYSPTTVKHTLAAVQGVFHWAVKHEILDFNPLVGYEKPKAHRRTRVITPEESVAYLSPLASASRSPAVACPPVARGLSRRTHSETSRSAACRAAV
jgi:hypothetical protein